MFSSNKSSIDPDGNLDLRGQTVSSLGRKKTNENFNVLQK